ncbi:Uncharacterised protein [Mycobacteroides abscessus subsp. abscessus]|nr:Uncharacterised protein [Mycobacteroides abscessus subsp. abscessus]
MVPTLTAITVAMSPIPMELTRAEVNTLPLKMPR